MSAVAATTRNPFVVETLFAPNAAGPVGRIACPRMRDLGSMDIHAMAHALAAVIMTAHLDSASNTTIILDVEETIVPLYVDFAIQDLLNHKFQGGVMVLCNGATSHDDDSSLPKALCINVCAVNRSGSLWHPIRQHLVPAQMNFSDIS
jgi:hypothetical protein